MTFFVINVGAMVLMATAAVFTSTPTRPSPPPSSTPRVTINLATSSEIDYNDTGTPNEELDSDNDVRDASPNTPQMNIEDIIRRTNANLAERGDPMLSEEEECIARAVASGSDRSICSGI